MFYLSLVIPCYNEEKILAGILKKIIAFLSKKKYEWEIVVVDDGSHDKTAKIAASFRRKGVRLIRFARNQGKGAALRAGILKSNAGYIVYTDADLSISIDQLDGMTKRLESGYPVVVGSRRVKGANIVVHQPFIREKMGCFFTFITRIVTDVDLRDFTCGFKGFEKKAAHDIFRRSVIDRWAYDAEIMFLTKKLGYKIDQLPVSWIDRRESRVRLGSATVTSFFDLLKVRINDLYGKYE